MVFLKYAPSFLSSYILIFSLTKYSLFLDFTCWNQLHLNLFTLLVLLHQWLAWPSRLLNFWVTTISYADHQVQSHQVNTQYCEAPSVFGIFPVLSSNTCSSHFLSQISQCLPCFALCVVSLPDWFTNFLCLHPTALMPVVLLTKRKGWDLADKKLRHLKMLPYYNAWTYHVLYCHIFPSFSCCSHHLYVYGPPFEEAFSGQWSILHVLLS